MSPTKQFILSLVLLACSLMLLAGTTVHLGRLPFRVSRNHLNDSVVAASQDKYSSCSDRSKTVATADVYNVCPIPPGWQLQLTHTEMIIGDTLNDSTMNCVIELETRPAGVDSLTAAGTVATFKTAEAFICNGESKTLNTRGEFCRIPLDIDDQNTFLPSGGWMRWDMVDGASTACSKMQGVQLEIYGELSPTL